MGHASMDLHGLAASEKKERYAVELARTRIAPAWVRVAPLPRADGRRTFAAAEVRTGPSARYTPLRISSLRPGNTTSIRRCPSGRAHSSGPMQIRARLGTGPGLPTRAMERMGLPEGVGITFQADIADERQGARALAEIAIPFRVE